MDSHKAAFFSGKTVVLTGTFATMKRSVAEQILKGAGAKVGSSVSAKTDFLIHGEDAGSKLHKAKSLGVATMTESEMVAKFVSSGDVPKELLGAEEKIAAKKADQDNRMAGVRETIAKVNEAQLARFGLPIGQLLLCWLRVFSKRPDVHVVKSELGAPAESSTLLSFYGRVPPHILALFSDIGSVHFWWVFQQYKHAIKDRSEGFYGGRINLLGLSRLDFYPRPSDHDWVDYAAEAMFDSLQAEGSTMLSYDPDEKPTDALLVFDDANDCERYVMGNALEYFTPGARRGFVWYWQRAEYWEARGFTALLFEHSLPKSTEAKLVVQGLIEKGLSELEAQAMVRWLGEDAVILLPAPSASEWKQRVNESKDE